MEELEIDLDLGGKGIDELEQGGKCTVPDWYLCVVADAERPTKNLGLINLTFQVTAGARKGERIYDTLWLPGYSNDPDKDAKGANRVGLIAQRLGLWSGNKADPCRPNFLLAIGRPAVVELVKQSWKDRETGEPKEKIAPAYAGVYPPDHPKVPDEVRKRLGLPPARVEAPKDAPGQTQLFAPPPPPASAVPPEFKSIPNAAARRQAVDLSDL